MTKKHYEKIASVLAAEVALNADNAKALQALRNVAMSIADVFALDNPRFNRDFFYAAAGVTL